MHTQFFLVLTTYCIVSHPFDGIPTFALTDHTLEFVCRQTFFFNNIFLSQNTSKIN